MELRNEVNELKMALYKATNIISGVLEIARDAYKLSSINSSTIMAQNDSIKSFLDSSKILGQTVIKLADRLNNDVDDADFWKRDDRFMEENDQDMI